MFFPVSTTYSLTGIQLFGDWQFSLLWDSSFYELKLGFIFLIFWATLPKRSWATFAAGCVFVFGDTYEDHFFAFVVSITLKKISEVFYVLR